MRYQIVKYFCLFFKISQMSNFGDGNPIHKYSHSLYLLIFVFASNFMRDSFLNLFLPKHMAFDFHRGKIMHTYRNNRFGYVRLHSMSGCDLSIHTHAEWTEKEGGDTSI